MLGSPASGGRGGRGGRGGGRGGDFSPASLAAARAHDPTAWLAAFEDAGGAPSGAHARSRGEDEGEPDDRPPQPRGATLRTLRHVIIAQTRAAVRAGSYVCDWDRDAGGWLPAPVRVVFDAAALARAAAAGFACLVEETQHAPESHTPAAAPRLTRGVLLVQCDCVAAAMWTAAALGGARVALLNMGAAGAPGMGGAGAQEENLHRRSNLHQHLAGIDVDLPAPRTWAYPLPKFGAVVSRDVIFFRRNEDDGYAFMREPFVCDVVTAAAMHSPDTVGVGEACRLTPRARADTLRKVLAILEAARVAGARGLVLSAFGCGAFGNPPADVARCFHEALFARGYAACFDAVVFAILDDHNAFRLHNPRGNFAPFVDVFGAECVASLADPPPPVLSPLQPQQQQQSEEEGEGEKKHAQPAPAHPAFPTRQFAESLGVAGTPPVHFLVVGLRASLFVWMGTSPAMPSLSVALARASAREPVASALLGADTGAAEEMLAARLVKRFAPAGVFAVYVSCEIPEMAGVLRLAAERRLVQELNVLVPEWVQAGLL